MRLSVSDTGTGIDLEQQAQIFEAFYQAESPDGKVRQGTGLGLSITKRLVDLMQGRIHVVSRVGEGATFRVDIPNLLPATIAAPEEMDARADFDRLPPLVHGAIGVQSRAPHAGRHEPPRESIGADLRT